MKGESPTLGEALHTISQGTFRLHCTTLYLLSSSVGQRRKHNSLGCQLPVGALARDGT